MSNLINISTILIKRGNTAAASNYVGPLGELLVDTGLQTLRLQDGSTPGGMSTLATTQQVSNVVVAIEGIQSNTANISALLANIHGTNISGISSNVTSLQYQLSANGTATIGNLTVNNIRFESNSYIWSAEDGQIQFSANGYNDQTGIYLNDQDVAVMYANTDVQLNSSAGVGGSSQTWTFDRFGNLTLPGNVVFADTTVQSTAYQGPAGQTSFATVANVTTANVALKGYVDSKIALLANAPAILDTLGQIATAIQNDEGNIGTILTSITATNANVAAANVAWQANAVTQLSQINAAIVTANLAVVAYVNAQDALLQSGITGANTAIVTANTAMKGYVDAVTTAWTSNAATQQTLINTINANITAANSTIATLQSNIGSFYTYANLTYGTSSYANANVAGYLAGNITIGNATATSFRSNNFLYSNGVSILSGISATPSLNSLSGNISWTASGFGTPTFNTSSVGSKLILWPQVNSTNVDYAVGIESGFTWFSIPQATNSFGYKWYAGTSNIASLYGNGALIVTNGVYSNSYNYANGVSILTGISGTYSNANVASYLPTYSGNITAGNVIVNGNIPMTSNVARYTWVANVAPTSGQGSVGDIWYQTF